MTLSGLALVSAARRPLWRSAGAHAASFPARVAKTSLGSIGASPRSEKDNEEHRSFQHRAALLKGGRAGILDTVLTEEGKPQEA